MRYSEPSDQTARMRKVNLVIDLFCRSAVRLSSLLKYRVLFADSF